MASGFQFFTGGRPVLRFSFLACLAGFAAGCGSGGTPATSTAAVVNPAAKSEAKGAKQDSASGQGESSQKASPKPQQNLYPIVEIKTSFGEIRIRLDAKKAPVTVDNFLSNYVQREFYNGTVLHHVEKGVMIAAGGYLPDQSAKEPREQILNEADNGLKNVRGAIAMARHPEHAYSATSQFFFNLSDNPDFDFRSRDKDEDYGYCVFGKVIEGLDVLDRIAAAPVQEHNGFPNWPVKPIVIESIRRTE